MENNRMKYSDIRELALKDNIADNKVSIGIWAKLNGWIKKCSKTRDRKNYYYYIKNED